MLILWPVPGGVNRPGIGQRFNPCALDAPSRWGTLPGLGWPVSYVGSAYFLGWLAACCVQPGRVERVMLAVARAGALASLFLAGVLVSEHLACSYCLAVHACSLLFWIV